MERDTKQNKQKKIIDQLLVVLHHYFFIVVILIFASIVASGFFFLLQQKYTSMTEKNRIEEEKKTEELASLQSYSERLRNYRNDYSKISSVDKEKIDAMIAGNYLPEDVFADMEKLILSRGLILNSIAVSTLSNSGVDTKKTGENGNSGLGEAVIKLDIAGINYEGLKQLLAIIEGSLKLMDVKKINFSPNQNTAVLEISTYFLK